jgi:hypothetical protein
MAHDRVRRDPAVRDGGVRVGDVATTSLQAERHGRGDVVERALAVLALGVRGTTPARAHPLGLLALATDRRATTCRPRASHTRTSIRPARVADDHPAATPPMSCMKHRGRSVRASPTRVPVTLGTFKTPLAVPAPLDDHPHDDRRGGASLGSGRDTRRPGGPHDLRCVSGPSAAR